ncbi:hypothetical protein ACFSC1_10575 [Paracoccus aurantiacus]|uniref:hypothetical protein n=1 Tax=Paracoccus aurantiacus TaxID=2599412 RepID=UPI001FE64A3B|nr:hypothetical protein [Paracoccus aurantiacus]
MFDHGKQRQAEIRWTWQGCRNVKHEKYRDFPGIWKRSGTRFRIRVEAPGTTFASCGISVEDCAETSAFCPEIFGCSDQGGWKGRNETARNHQTDRSRPGRSWSGVRRRCEGIEV